MLLAGALASVWAGASVARALAEACAGSGAGPCPYAAAQIIGQRAEGVLRFPEAVAVNTQGDVYVADRLSYVVPPPPAHLRQSGAPMAAASVSSVRSTVSVDGTAVLSGVRPTRRR